jgi:hypothetical protein
MAFEQIGPYGLSRRDVLAASLVIGFSAGSIKTRLWCFGLLFVGLAGMAMTLLAGERFFAAIIAFWLIYVFVLGPLLRSLKDSHDICLSYDPDGIRADTPKTQTLYKWATIGRVVRFGPRLFVMINGRCGVVVSERFTTAANVDAVAATVRQHALV